MSAAGARRLSAEGAAVSVGPYGRSGHPDSDVTVLECLFVTKNILSNLPKSSKTNKISRNANQLIFPATA